MLKIRQICLPVVLSLFAAMPAQAKVTPIHEYNQAVVDDGSSSITISCENYNYYDSPVTNAICTQQNMPDGTVCYSCRCDTSDFPYTESDCGTTGFVPGTTSCALREGTRYSTCLCDTANGWYDESEFVSDVDTKFTITSDDTGKIEASGTKDALTCYRASGFSCKTGTSIPWSDIQRTTNNSTATTNSDGPEFVYHIEYPFREGPDNRTVVCAVGLKSIPDSMVSSIPSGETYKCLDFGGSKQATYTGDTYYYVDGCSDSAPCTTSQNTCIVTNSSSFPEWDTATLTTSYTGWNCRFEQEGCQLGVSTDNNGESVFCTDTEPNSTYFTYTSIPHKNGTETCYAVSSCNTANDYELAYLGVISATDFTKDDATNYTYDVDSVVVSITNDTPVDDGDSNAHKPLVGQSYQMTCRTPSGCRTDKGYYNFACDGGCWDGWLSLWLEKEQTSAEKCIDAGYSMSSKSCVDGYKLDTCPYNSAYTKCVIDRTARQCIDEGYSTILKRCNDGYELDTCPNNSAYTKCVLDRSVRQCIDAGYDTTLKSCSFGQKLDTCPYNSAYTKCVISVTILPGDGIEVVKDTCASKGYFIAGSAAASACPYGHKSAGVSADDGPCYICCSAAENSSGFACMSNSTVIMQQ